MTLLLATHTDYAWITAVFVYLYTPWRMIAAAAVGLWCLCGNRTSRERWAWIPLAFIYGGVVPGAIVFLVIWISPARRAAIVRWFWLQRADIPSLRRREQRHMQDQLELWKEYADLHGEPEEHREQFARESAMLAARHEHYKERVRQAVRDERFEQMRKDH